MDSIPVTYVLLHLAALQFGEILRKGVQFAGSSLHLVFMSTSTLPFPLPS